jgi:hypothetical protein
LAFKARNPLFQADVVRSRKRVYISSDLSLSCLSTPILQQFDRLHISWHRPEYGLRPRNPPVVLSSILRFQPAIHPSISSRCFLGQQSSALSSTLPLSLQPALRLPVRRSNLQSTKRHRKHLLRTDGAPFISTSETPGWMCYVKLSCL